MYIEKVMIENFRNFRRVQFNTQEKNIIIGVNDVGKTNLLTALHKLFDYKQRNKEILDTDFHKKSINNNITICARINFEEEDLYRDILISNIKDLRKNETQNQLDIRLTYRKDDITTMEWKCYPSEDDWINIPSFGINRLLIDNIFSTEYIDPRIKIETNFKNFKNTIISDIGKDNLSELVDIEQKFTDVNSLVQELPEVGVINEKLNAQLENLDMNFEVKVQSSIGLNGVYDNLDVFMNEKGSDDNVTNYPTAGDGRKKVVEYAMHKHNIENTTRKIPITLLEEPENHLHISLQKQLSKTMFEIGIVFVTSHSAELLHEIPEGVNVIKLESKGSSIFAENACIEVPDEIQKLKQLYQREIVNAMFCSNVFLVEGYSEKIFWEFVLNEKIKTSEDRNNIYVLNIIGTDFAPYYNFLTELKINVYVRTDNDLKKSGENCNLSGINRGLDLLGEAKLPNIEETLVARNDESPDDLLTRWRISRRVFDDYNKEISLLKNKNIYLSKVDFENSLADSLFAEEEMEKKSEFIKELQQSKWHNLLSSDFASQIFDSSNLETILQSGEFEGLHNFIQSINGVCNEND
ncbi:AAA family ATPase [Mollicutes bacterium LVI A0039]|nr:AAA family ATPase [Mollicutes bacterium LVI A0039]